MSDKPEKMAAPYITQEQFDRVFPVSDKTDHYEQMMEHGMSIFSVDKSADKPVVSDAEVKTAWDDFTGSLGGYGARLREVLEQFLANRAVQPALQAEPAGFIENQLKPYLRHNSLSLSPSVTGLENPTPLYTAPPHAEPVRVRLLTSGEVQAAYAALRRGDLTLLPAQTALLAKIAKDNPHIKFEIEGEAG